MQRLRSATMCAAFALVLVPSLSSAQALNFDEVCASPPCAAGSAYTAAWGITINPASLQIVEAGTNGITGTSGGRYLSVAPAPNQATIQLSRPATFASVDVARSSLGSAGQTVTLQALSNGAPVGTPQMVTLGDVGAWTTLRVVVSGGFDALFLDTAGGGADRTFGVDNVRIAGNCAGFADVPGSESFCGSVEWLYNRGITLGCALGQFCPDLPVTRAQMALFMQRLGTAVSTGFLVGPTTVHSAVDLATPLTCTTTTPLTPAFSRAATALGHVILTQASVAPQTVSAHVVVSINGQPFVAIDNAENTYRTMHDTGSNHSMTPFGGPMTLQAGNTYVFGVRAQRFAGSGTTTLSCNMRVDVHHSTSNTAPFDAAGAGGGVARR